MKKVLLLFVLLPQLLLAQKIVKLSVVQPPEFGFSVAKTDTTIVKGRSVVLGTDLIVFGGSGEYLYSWSPQTTLNNATVLNPVATPTDTTTYILTVADENGCSFSIDYKVNVRNPMVGIEDADLPAGLEAVLFPNPNNGKFKVKLTGNPSEKIVLTIIDASGKIVKNQTIKNFTGEHTETVQVSLVSGIYTLKIESDSETLSRQFIIN
jgi:hypothetical protein